MFLCFSFEANKDSKVRNAFGQKAMKMAEKPEGYQAMFQVKATLGSIFPNAPQLIS